MERAGCVMLPVPLPATPGALASNPSQQVGGPCEAPGGWRWAGPGRCISLQPPATQRGSHVSFSLREEFLGPSRCCPIPWIPPDNKVEGRAGPPTAWGVCAVGPHFPPHSSPPLSCRAPQHGRINAENEPSPRHGAHGARPTGNPLSVCPSSWPSMCTRLLSSFHRLSVVHVTQFAGVRGENTAQSPAACSAHGWAGPPHSQEQPPLVGGRPD